MSNKARKTKYVLMVCVDNICRSPIAEAVLRDIIVKDNLHSNWRVDSAAIEAWHLGARPDDRALSVLRQHNINYHSCARRLTPEDFEKFDYILGMDQSILASLKLLQPYYAKSQLLMLGDFLFGLKPNERIIEDPYYEMGEEPFQKIYEQCAHACGNFLKQARHDEIIT
ncbi:low molecular weight phosphotyrosine protein phosphatase 2-like [Drosophila montana]|uniref:low molecular weight phosphotyrosine protein phosphatase 2-like n=1 Tax=Drosophila montana TaxID=40370 RepID=UPI00313DBD82